MIRGVTRRRVLRFAGAGALGVLGTESAAAGRSRRYIVGTSTPAATRAAERRADAVRRVLDFGDVGQAVAGTFPEEALRGLRNRPDVRYVERDGTVRAIGIDATDSEVPWGVDRVDAEKTHTDGATGDVVDSATHDVGGSTGGGTDTFQIKHADGQTFDVTLTVTDLAGNSTKSESKTVTE